MSKREVRSVQWKYESDGLHEGVRRICMTQRGKELSVMTRTRNILEKYGFKEEAKMLRGGKFIHCFFLVICSKQLTSSVFGSI